ncbi:hypothetical protein jhhlp_008131 [Lomentospora prolificans]|uniref:3'(2'),5'-bisphosphate nucleotidase n=1 Tax=Lomentospora prolificans TaxID=41688 RepID=A0A2N3MZK3_9PEZI|nr:hypothetical protein jhhlp_008131 [Lomentospora prolificans]
MESPYAKEIQIAISVIQQAALLSQSVISSPDKGVVEKNDLSPVTIADFAVQALLSATFHHHFPEDGLVGEESADELRSNEKLLDRLWGLVQGVGARAGDADEASRLWRTPESKEHACDLIDMCGSGAPRPGRVWVFDPIDGTKTYMRGEMYAINCALLQDGKQVLSIVGLPNLSPDTTEPVSDKDIDRSGRGTVLFGAKGHGAYLLPLHNNASGVQPRRLAARAEASVPGQRRFVTCTTVTDSGDDDLHRAVATSIGASFPGCNLLPWVARWCALAMGLGDAVVWVYNKTSRRGKVWDHAGAMLLFEEAGGKVTDVYGRDIDLSGGRTMDANFSFVAAVEGLHEEVLTKTHQVLREFGRKDVLEQLAKL